MTMISFGRFYGQSQSSLRQYNASLFARQNQAANLQTQTVSSFVSL